MKKLLIVNNNLHIGGVQKALVDLLWTIRGEYEVTLVLLYAGGAYLPQLPPEVKVIPAGGAYRYLGMGRTDARTLPDRLGRGLFAGITRIFGRKWAISLMAPGQKPLEGFDVAISYVHSPRDRQFFGGCNEFLLRHVRAKKKITFLHCDYPSCGADTAENAALYHRFDLIAACSRGCARAFCRCRPELKDRVRVVPNCHRFQRIRTLGENASLTLPEGRTNLVTVARFGREKGVDRAIEVLGKLKHRPDWHYYLVGGGIQDKTLRSRVKELGLEDRVTFCGLLEDPYGYLAAADLLWIPSRSDAAPLVIGEAAALGTPILSTETSSAREMVEERGLGWVCENSREAMEAALITLLGSGEAVREKKRSLRNKSFDNCAAKAAFAACVAEENHENRRHKC